MTKKLPYKFSYVFTTEDDKERTLMVEDWELGALYWNCLKRAKGDEELACQKVKEKYYDYMVNRCDLHFFLGTTKRFHNIGQYRNWGLDAVVFLLNLFIYKRLPSSRVN